MCKIGYGFPKLSNSERLMVLKQDVRKSQRLVVGLKDTVNLMVHDFLN